jgi:hypothetical protein
MTWSAIVLTFGIRISVNTALRNTVKQSFSTHSTQVNTLNPLTPNDLQRRSAVSPLKINISSKNMRENQQIHQLFIQFINYVW